MAEATWRGFLAREAGMVLGGALAAAASPAPLATAGLGAGAAAALLVVHRFCRNRLARGERPKAVVLGLAALGSLALAWPVIWVGGGTGRVLGWVLLVQGAYAARWVLGPWGSGLWIAGTAWLLGRWAGAACAWWGAMALLDPAWSTVRWARVWPGRPGSGACPLSGPQ